MDYRGAPRTYKLVTMIDSNWHPHKPMTVEEYRAKASRDFRELISLCIELERLTDHQSTHKKESLGLWQRLRCYGKSLSP